MILEADICTADSRLLERTIAWEPNAERSMSQELPAASGWEQSNHPRRSERCFTHCVCMIHRSSPMRSARHCVNKCSWDAAESACRTISYAGSEARDAISWIERKVFSKPRQSQATAFAGTSCSCVTSSMTCVIRTESVSTTSSGDSTGSPSHSLSRLSGTPPK